MVSEPMFEPTSQVSRVLQTIYFESTDHPTSSTGTAPKDPAAVKMDSHPVPNPEHHGHHHGHHDDGHYHTKHHESYHHGHHHGHHPNHYSASNIVPIAQVPSKLLREAEPYLELFN